MTDTNEIATKREELRLSLICLIGGALFLALVAYNLVAAGSVITTDGLFFTVVPLVLGLSLLAMPAMDFLKKRREAKSAAGSAAAAESVGSAHAVAVSEPVEHVHFAGSNRLFISVWLWLLLLTSFEVFLGYIHLPVIYMLVILMGASIVKAALIVAYFMHLRFERLILVLTIVPAVVVCICLLLIFFPDSFRSRELRYGPPPAPATSESH